MDSKFWYITLMVISSVLGAFASMFFLSLMLRDTIDPKNNNPFGLIIRTIMTKIFFVPDNTRDFHNSKEQKQRLN